MASAQPALRSKDASSGIGRFAILPSRAFFDSRLGKTQILVLGLICSYVDRNGWCFPSMQTIADRLGTSREAVRKSIRLLETAGYLQVSARSRPNGSQTSNLYRVLYDPGLPTEQDVEVEYEQLELEKEPQPEKKPAPEKKQNVNMMNLAKALAVVCNMELAANLGRLLSEAKMVAGLTDFSMDNLDRLYGRDGLWYQQDFRGKRGSPPTPSQIRATWLELLGSAVPEGKTNSEEGWFYV